MEIYMVTDRKTHRLIGLFDDEHSDKFYVGADIRIGEKIYKGGMKLVKEEYRIWSLTLNVERMESTLKVSKARDIKEKEVS